ncbi:MAG TPA: hypothetical protein VNS58_03300 [Puia sp.]|nr:hypothetical protein [Puia sp.]
MNLLSDEHLLVSSNDDKIILTDQRIHMTDKIWGKTYQITIFLEDISSIEHLYRNNVFYIVLAMLSFFLSIISIGSGANTATIYAGFIVGGIFLTLWLSSRQRLIKISSKGGGALCFIIEGMNEAYIDDFLHKVQEAKSNRLKDL